ncbi:MAG: C40 family peptidase [Rhodobacter sp.]|nr:C40 family peptidase [Rhodobacter sp.]
MTDRRFLRAARGIAHDSLAGALDGHRLTAGTWWRVAAPLADLCDSPGGMRDRQLLMGTRFCVLTRDADHAFGFDGDDGYCGWLDTQALADDQPPTHWVAAPATHLYPAPDIKTRERATVSIGARLRVTDRSGAFATTPAGHVPARHLRPLGDWRADPVAVARDLLGTPYLWGGNSRDGIDCSGLVQVARRACGLACPPDSDLQRAMAGADVVPGAEEPGDLIFWAGHVGMVSAPGRLIHANAHHMAVVEEDLEPAIARIAATGSAVLRRLRP